MVRLSLGSNIVGDEIKEGDDLYIECHIRSNPAFHRLLWSHNVIKNRRLWLCLVVHSSHIFNVKTRPPV